MRLCKKKPAEQRASFVRKSFHIFSNTHDTSFMVTVTWIAWLKLANVQYYTITKNWLIYIKIKLNLCLKNINVRLQHKKSDLVWASYHIGSVFTFLCFWITRVTTKIWENLNTMIQKNKSFFSLKKYGFANKINYFSL